MATNVYDSRTLVSVNPFTGSGLLYGFKTNVDTNRRAALGHTPVDLANLPASLIIGANRPKPGRASKRFSTGYSSSFYDIANAGALRSDGWSLSAPHIRRASQSDFSNAYYVTIGTVKYAWKMPKTQATLISGTLSALGIQTPTANDKDLVWGASYPKPARVFTRIADDIVSTFVDPSRIDNLPEGWGASGDEETF